MPGISIHVIDVTRGEPARGMAVVVFRRDERGGLVRVGGGAIGEAGLLDDAALGRGDGLLPGGYEVELAAGPYYRTHGISVDSPAFQESVVYRFHLQDVVEHVHLPVKLSPWGLSVWRGR